LIDAGGETDEVEGLIKLVESKKSTDEINKYFKKVPSLKKPYLDFLKLQEKG